MTDRLRVPIDRATWVNGRYDGNHRMGESSLLNGMGCQCCLGKLGTALGAPENVLLDVPLPATGTGIWSYWPDKLFDLSNWSHEYGDDGDWRYAIARINDARYVPDAIREAWIAEGFRTVLDCEADFFGDYPEVT